MYLSTQSIKRLLFPGLFMLAAVKVDAQGKIDSVSVKETVSERKTKSLSVSGTIKDAASGKLLPGISISVEGYSASLTDDKGRFSISVPNNNAVLVIASQGYQTKRVAVSSGKALKVMLYEESFNSIYDEVILPLGSKPKSQTTLSVESVNIKGGWNRANETADSYLQGQVSGLYSQRRSGTPGIGADMMIRGFNSLYGSNQPLIVVDGVIYDNNNYSNSIIAGHRVNHLANVDVKDIDNITVVKDGAGLYGAKGANGVIFITTNRAINETTRFDFGAYGGFNSTVDNIPVMEAGAYRTYLSDILRTSGLTDGGIQALPFMNDDNNPDTNPDYFNYHQNTNWQDKVKTGGINQNYYLKVSGGDNIAKYALSLGYLYNEGLTKNTDLNRYQTRFNADLNFTKKLKGFLRLAFARSEQNLKDQGRSFDTNPLFLSLVKAPFLSSHVLSPVGVESPNLSNYDGFMVSNPYAIVENMDSKSRNYRFSGNVGFNYSFSRHFSLQSIVGLTFDKVRENSFRQALGIVPVQLATAVGVNSPGANVERLFSLYTDTWLSYQKDFNKKSFLKASAGFRFNNNKTESDAGVSYNTASDEFVTLSSGRSNLRTITGDLGEWNWLNSYLSADYNLLNKYFLTFNISGDASSRFGKDFSGGVDVGAARLAFFPSVAAGWLISSESFMAGAPFIEALKLRGSYGLSGNDDIGNYNSKTTYVSQNFLGRQGIVRYNIGNSALQWETNRKLNLGIDASFLKERLSLSIDFFNNNINDMLLYSATNSFTGFDYALTNLGSMRNRGVELSINGRIVNTIKSKWDLGLNIGTYRNKVTAVPLYNPVSFAGANYMIREGYAANLFYGYRTNGVYASDTEAAASGLQNQLSSGNIVSLQGGDVRFVNVNGDNLINDEDKVIIGDPNPDFAGAFNNHLSYKRWSLNALFTFSVGNDVYNGTRASLESMNGYYNQTAAVLNRWRTDGQVTNMPRAAWGDPSENGRFSDRWIEDGSYLRLRTISLSYDVPLKSGFLKSATVYATANNVFTLTKYLGYDPEFSATGSPFAIGVDTGLEPQFRSMQLGVRIGL